MIVVNSNRQRSVGVRSFLRVNTLSKLSKIRLKVWTRENALKSNSKSHQRHPNFPNVDWADSVLERQCTYGSSDIRSYATCNAVAASSSYRLRSLLPTIRTCLGGNQGSRDRGPILRHQLHVNYPSSKTGLVWSGRAVLS